MWIGFFFIKQTFESWIQLPKKLKIPLDKIIQNLDEYGNTSAASIPLALEQAVREGKIKKGDIIACSGFGAGLSWGAAILKWG
mmetsp:Transcript_5986/g.7905  ORF Transcript_5986/g.7905 Transcript_5986/m.7905 type:complete len:83 (-) Transcript_5986:341-589(-)